jgi:Calcineurin-like phosphoesterase
MSLLRLLWSGVFLCILVVCGLDLSAQSGRTWSFAVSGDSRNCGDIVMPAIAQGVRKDQAQFYWHLGDFRASSDFDEDILAAPEYRSKRPSVAEYQKLEWRDFIAQQIEPFGDTPVFLAIGNHELVLPKIRADYLQQFADWLDSPVLRSQRLKDDRHDHQLHTYYHWIQGGVDFISLDNASKDQFDDEQLAWIERTLALDESNAEVRTVVVGMHDALPDSLSAGHSMNESAQMERSGRRVYQELLAFRAKTKKHVYVLASHSHFFIEDVYHDACHSAPNSVLPGWIVGTAGAVRYRLPANVSGAKQARTDVYGYLLATVQADGEIAFEFKEVKTDDIPSQVADRYGKQVQACFAENKSTYVPAGPDCVGQ